MADEIKEIKKEFEKIWYAINALKGEEHKRLKENSKEESLREYYKKFNVKMDTDKTLVIMSFLELSKKINEISSKDIEDGFKEMREIVPGNISDKLYKLAKRGFIMYLNKDKNSNLWKLTNSGETHIQKLLK